MEGFLFNLFCLFVKHFYIFFGCCTCFVMIFAFFGKNPTNTKKYPIGYPDFSVGAKYVQFFQGYLKEWFFTSFLKVRFGKLF